MKSRDQINAELDRQIARLPAITDTDPYDQGYREGWDEHGNAHECGLDPHDSHVDAEDRIAKRKEINAQLDKVIERLRRGY